jgi:subtilisin family serine protease
MKRATSEKTVRKTSSRLIAMVVAVVFVMSTMFVPTGALAAENAGTEDTVTAKTTAAEATVAETEEGTDTENASAEDAAAEPEKTVQDQSEQDSALAADEDAGTLAELEDLVTAHNENGDAAALEDLSDSDYDGFIYKLEDDATKREVKEMETAIEELAEDPESGEAAAVIENEIYTADSLETIDAVADPDLIEYIEPNYKVSLMDTGSTAVINDPYYEDYGWYLDMIKAPYVWNRGAYGKGAVVAVIDSGVMTNHPDFENTQFTTGYNAVEESTDVTDPDGHGTGMAGIIAASYNNGRGLAGIMPKAKIMPVKVFRTAQEGQISWLIKGIEYATSHGASVINMSVGVPQYSVAMEDACKNAVAKGIILVAAAGNDGNGTVYYPACFSTVVSVGSIESDGARSGFSNYNKYVDVVAPGRGIILPSKRGTKVGYYTLTGTSASTPQVAAMAAMVKSMDKSVNGTGFMEILKKTCIDKGAAGRDNEFGYGLIDLRRVYCYMTGSFSMYSAKLSSVSYTFNGKTKTPAVTVKKANKILPKVDYRTTYPKTRKAVGTYQVKVTGVDPYKGTKILTYKILPPLVKKIKKPKRYKKKLKVKWYAMSKSQQTKYRSAITGFQVRVSKSSKFTNAKYVRVQGITKTSATVKGLKRKTKYYVQYRVYKTVGKKTYYSKWSGKKKVKTK